MICRHHVFHQLKAANIAYVQHIAAQLSLQEQQANLALRNAAHKSQFAAVAVADRLLLLLTRQGSSRGALVPLWGPLAMAVATHLQGWGR